MQAPFRLETYIKDDILHKLKKQTDNEKED
jgi:hypothetical protein